ncbi:bone morphogenetic protein receptor type-1B-like [Trichogramma pretiosum]|uniref:bone morphogenetic protein receptor type-1B-like n=1 Tax=Trichogramma pretiosum TaxID=7493 RepID=UPI0006C94924|nr:bone morphogenetic protein receptor type-1B-like [Trichogramma pretiosum]
MHQTICTNRLRPFIPPEWAADNILKSMGHLLETCWEEDPRSRPTVEIIKQSLEVIKEEGDIAEELL